MTEAFLSSIRESEKRSLDLLMNGRLYLTAQDVRHIGYVLITSETAVGTLKELEVNVLYRGQTKTKNRHQEYNELGMFHQVKFKHVRNWDTTNKRTADGNQVAISEVLAQALGFKDGYHYTRMPEYFMRYDGKLTDPKDLLTKYVKSRLVVALDEGYYSHSNEAKRKQEWGEHPKECGFNLELDISRSEVRRLQEKGIPVMKVLALKQGCTEKEMSRLLTEKWIKDAEVVDPEDLPHDKDDYLAKNINMNFVIQSSPFNVEDLRSNLKKMEDSIYDAEYPTLLTKGNNLSITLFGENATQEPTLFNNIVNLQTSYEKVIEAGYAELDKILVFMGLNPKALSVKDNAQLNIEVEAVGKYCTQYSLRGEAVVAVAVQDDDGKIFSAVNSILNSKEADACAWREQNQAKPKTKAK